MTEMKNIDKKSYILTKRGLERVLNKRFTLQLYEKDGYRHTVEGRYRELHCSSCSGLLRVGDLVVAKRTKSYQRQYHADCAEKLNIWLDEAFCALQHSSTS